ncbi:hypothetical protein RRX38_23400 [Pseudomonas sp. DTU_2021_1001937_2_SI_NGA_ILE_001]|nr:hypothetical protein [Pseudomonas sp. DTU_2021_1001937_2_SI_NGA_ILE_001]WNW13979.1 hypothetical protein RRX38_23400 [Pseudomonas sp. DTU_2021_1001937_2_SI_NGA_ILE_001]
MHEIPNFPFTSNQETAQSALAQQELGVAAEHQSTPADDSQQTLGED